MITTSELKFFIIGTLVASFSACDTELYTYKNIKYFIVKIFHILQ